MQVSPMALGGFQEFALSGAGKIHDLVIVGAGSAGIAAAKTATALGLDAWPASYVDLDHPSLAGVPEGEVEAALIFGCGADVFSL